MQLFDLIAGYSKNDPKLVGHVFNEILESQRVRVSQSRNALPLVSGAGLIYIIGLWDEVNRAHLIAWIGLNIALAFVRTFICFRVEKSLDGITTDKLYRNDLLLFISALCSTTALGTGFWWVCLDGSERVILAVTILSCIYAVGTTVNSAIHSRGMEILLISNLGQGIVFFGFVRSPVDFEVAVALMALIYLLVQFCKRISTLFGDSIRIRDENLLKNQKLQEQKAMIEQSLKAAQVANDDKNRFLAAASHDLRQPLHAMTLFLGSLRRLVTGQRAMELVEKIDETTHVLHRQFNSLLDLSKFDAGVVDTNISIFRLDTLLQKIVDGVAPEAVSKGIGVKFSVAPIRVATDVLLLERLLTNLVVNAVNFTEAGFVEIQVEETDNHVVVNVRDTGRGISQEDQGKIFRDYYQVHNKARSKGKGTGLGLAIVKRIAALLEIEVAVTSRLGQGSTFSVSIPGIRRDLEPATVAAEAVTARNAQFNGERQLHLNGARVLIVDDDTLILEALSGVIADWGGISFRAVNLSEVKELLQSAGSFDMAILDDMLADEITGLDIAEFLSSSLSADRVLITTGNTDEIRLRQLRDSGYQVLTKPIANHRLRATLAEIMGITLV